MPTNEYVKRITQIANSLGLQLQFGSDFRKFREIYKQQLLTSGIDPIFDPDISGICSANGFWMIGHNNAGEIVHTQAMRMIDLCGVTLGEHLRLHLGDYRPHYHEVNVRKSRYCLTPAASNITGRVSYHGALWLMGGPAGYRGGCLTAILTRLMLARCLMQWSPDFMIGIQSPKIACRGLSAREGYMRLEQRSILWQVDDSDIPVEEWLVWMSQDEAKFNLRVPPEVFYELYELGDEINKSPPELLRKTA